jgi:hypothetical protein
LNAVEITVDVDPHKHPRVVGRSAGGRRINALKAEFAKIQLVDKDINDAHRIGIGNIVIQTFRQQRALRATFAFNETLHWCAFMRNMPTSYHRRRFDTLWAECRPIHVNPISLKAMTRRCLI